jgi:hypothetical protein
MAGNGDPIFSRIGDVTKDGATGMNQLVLLGANNSLVWTADATNGGFIQRLRFKAGGTNVATVARIYINNGSANTTAANNTLYGELSLLATTATATGSLPDMDYSMGFALPPGFRIYVGYGTATAAGWAVTPIAGKY